MAPKKYSVSSNFFRSINTSDKAYILGLFFSDGNVRKCRSQISIKMAEKYMIEYVIDKMCYTGVIYQEKHKKHKDAYSVVMTDNNLKYDLMALGCGYNKSYNVKFPNIDDSVMPDFVRGYFDGDGCIYCGVDKRNDRLYGEVVICSSKIFCDGLKKWLDKNNIYSSLFRDKKHDVRVGKIRVRRNNDLIKFYNLIYSGIDNKMFLKRKYKKYTDFILNKFGEEELC